MPLVSRDPNRKPSAPVERRVSPGVVPEKLPDTLKPGERMKGAEFQKRLNQAPTIVEAARNAGKSVIRRMGLLRQRSVSGQAKCWAACRQCPVYVKRGNREYCGQPYLERLGEALHTGFPDQPGCGCNLRAKIPDPSASCPRNEWGPEEFEHNNITILQADESTKSTQSTK